MLSRIVAVWFIMALCVVVHATGLALALWQVPRAVGPHPRLGGLTWLFVRLSTWLVLLHLVQIALWALYLAGAGALPDVLTALYFSAVTYTTTGYGDVLLSQDWRLASGVEALTGILMCGLSAAFFFAVVTRVYDAVVKGHHR